MQNICKDCKYYLPIDVFKGMCKKTKKDANPDDTQEGCFEKQQMCKFCKNFKLSNANENLGKCMNKTIAYPSMTAKTCRNFIWK
jgi:hypothetical protein